MKRKVQSYLYILVICVLIASLCSCSGKEASLLGTWEERSFTTSWGRTDTYEAGEGDKFTLGKDGKIIDADHFFGSWFSYSGYYDVYSWDLQDSTIILNMQYGNVAYIDFTLKGKTLTLLFDDGYSFTFYKIK